MIKCDGGLGSFFMILVQSTEEIEPSERAFDLPSTFLGDESFLGFGFLGDFDLPIMVRSSHLKLPLIGMVRADEG